MNISKNINTMGWLTLRLAALNIFVLGIALLMAYVRHLVYPLISFESSFSFQLYIISLFLANLVYVMGNIFELFYLRLWNKKLDIKQFEGKFFKTAIALIMIVNVTGIVVFLINYFK